MTRSFLLGAPLALCPPAFLTAEVSSPLRKPAWEGGRQPITLSRQMGDEM